MAKIGTLGDIIFTVSNNQVKTFDGLQMESKTQYNKLTRHLKKPLLEFGYNDTDSLSFSMYFSVFLGVNPLEQQKKIDKYMKQGKILRMIVGGKKYGTRWVITSHSKNYKTFDKKGNLLISESKISLEEYAER